MKEQIEYIRRILPAVSSADEVAELDKLVDSMINDFDFDIELAEINYEILKKDIAGYALRQQIIKELE